MNKKEIISVLCIVFGGYAVLTTKDPSFIESAVAFSVLCLGLGIQVYSFLEKEKKK